MSNKKNLKADLAPESLKAAELNRPYWEQDARFLNPFEYIQEIPVWGTIGGRRALPRQGIITFSAKPKQGKSLSVNALLLCIVSGREFSSFKPSGERPRLAVVFDTEMDTPTLQTRAKSLREQLGEYADNVQIVPLLTTPKADRRRVVEEITAKFNPDIVVIDQAARMVNDYNDSKESTDFGEWLSMFAAERSVFVVVHQNKAADNEQMRGHLGARLDELAVENYKVLAAKGRIYNVEIVNSRSSCVEDAEAFTFALNDNGIIADPTAAIQEQKEAERRRWITDLTPIFGDDSTLQRAEILRRISQMQGLQPDAARTKFDNAVKCGSIEKTGKESRAPYRLADLNDSNLS